MESVINLTMIALDVKYDPYYVLYVDGEKFDEGDDYHEKLSYKFEGIKEFLKFAKIPFKAYELNFNTKEDASYSDWQFQPKENESLYQYLKRVRKHSDEVL